MKDLVQAMVIALVASSCVPAGPPPEARGAVGVAMLPSAATRGETFLTSDGWAVTIERVTLFAMVTAVEANATTGEPAEGLFLWNARERTELVLRAAGAGPRIVRTQFLGQGSFTIEGAGESFYTNMDVDPALEARVGLPPDGLEHLDPAAGETPRVGVILAFRGEKGGRAITLDVALAGRDSDAGQPVEVRANAITFVERDVMTERLFDVDSETETTGLQEIADADLDGDGHISGAELRDTVIVRSEEEISLLEWLTRRTTAILVPH